MLFSTSTLSSDAPSRGNATNASINLILPEVEVEQSLTPHPTQNRSFWRRSSQPITWPILTNKAVQENKHTVTKYKHRQENKHAKTKYKSDKADKLKYSTTKLPWFSRLLRHSARKGGGLILQWYQTWAPKPTRGCQRWRSLSHIFAADTMGISSFKFLSLLRR